MEKNILASERDLVLKLVIHEWKNMTEQLEAPSHTKHTVNYLTSVSPSSSSLVFFISPLPELLRARAASQNASNSEES